MPAEQEPPLFAATRQVAPKPAHVELARASAALDLSQLAFQLDTLRLPHLDAAHDRRDVTAGVESRGEAGKLVLNPRELRLQRLPFGLAVEIQRSSAAMSDALCQRASGSFSRQRWTRRSSAGGVSG